MRLFEGWKVHEPGIILKVLHDEFQFMHKISENQMNLFSFCEGVNMPQLSSIDSVSCKGFIKLEECTKIVNSMKVITGPGIDGLGQAFYKVFWTKFRPLYPKSRESTSENCLQHKDFD